MSKQSNPIALSNGPGATHAFVFPGQGSQYVGMGAEVIARSDAAREVMDRADEAQDLDV